MKYHWNISKDDIGDFISANNFDSEDKDGNKLWPTDDNLSEWGYAIDMNAKGTGFLIVAFIQIVFMFCCCGLARKFQTDDEKAESNERMQVLKGFGDMSTISQNKQAPLKYSKVNDSD